MSQMTNLEHERAKEAWSTIDFVNTKLDDIGFKREYRSIVLKFPTLIMINGLGQAVAFLKAKGKNDVRKAEEKLYRDIEGWLDKRIQWNVTGELIEKIITLPSDKFRLVTAETLSYLSWMKRFADAVLPKEED